MPTYATCISYRKDDTGTKSTTLCGRALLSKLWSLSSCWCWLSMRAGWKQLAHMSKPWLVAPMRQCFAYSHTWVFCFSGFYSPCAAHFVHCCRCWTDAALPLGLLHYISAVDALRVLLCSFRCVHISEVLCTIPRFCKARCSLTGDEIFGVQFLSNGEEQPSILLGFTLFTHLGTP